MVIAISGYVSVAMVPYLFCNWTKKIISISEKLINGENKILHWLVIYLFVTFIKKGIKMLKIAR